MNVHIVNGARRGTQSIFDDQDLQRAIEAYRFFYPTVSMEAIFQGNRDLGIRDGEQFAVLSAGPRHTIFTANSDTPYASGVLDLETTGSVVVDLPPGPFIALLDDHNHRWIADMGVPGPDQGRGGKYLVVPPGWSDDAPDGHRVARSDTFKVMFAARAVPSGPGGVSAAMSALRRVSVYPLSDPAAIVPYVDVTHRTLDATPLRWEDNIEFWARLHDVVDQEPAVDEYRAMYGVLAALGIQKGARFAPDRRMRRILESAAKLALEQMRVEGFASGRADRVVWPDRRWEWVGLVADDANFETRDFIDLQARDRWFVQAIAASPSMFRRKVGAGSIYFLCARDDEGAWLDGGRSYRLVVPHPVPAKMFWSLTAYDAKTRSEVRTQQDKAVLGSLHDTFEHEADGSIEIYLGPTPPNDDRMRRQWIQTTPGTEVFVYFRIYGPEAASLDGTWKLDDVRSTDASLRAPRPKPRPVAAETIVSLSTPSVVDTTVGRLELPRGVPTEETLEKVYDNLDRVHAFDTFLNAFQAVSLYAMRKGFHDIGVQDNDVLLFSGLMDSKSLFLTANCDTLYFLSFLDLSHGPIVLQTPRNVLGVVDDMWFRWVCDVGLAGADRGQGGKHLFVPPGYTGPLPEGGFYVHHPKTMHLLLLGRAFLEDDDPSPAAARIREELRIHPYAPGAIGSSVGAFLRGRGLFSALGEDPPTRIVEGTGVEMNTIPPNDLSFFEMLDAVVQLEAASALEPELAGHFGALGILKGHRFAPDARMKEILREAIALANATARTISFRPRPEEGFAYYDDRSMWMNSLFVGGYEFSRPPPTITKHGIALLPDPHARCLDSRTAMFYIATGITPAMCMRLTGIGSQYVAALHDGTGSAFQGEKTYRLRLPREIPAKQFWSITLYDNQTRSMLQTDQRFPRAGSQGYPTPPARADADGSTTIWFGPKRPSDVAAGNFVQTMPAQGWFAILRFYNPLDAFFDKSWRPGEIEEVMR
jgi:hypothetical protein